jgi:hypothetical protein
LTRIERLLIRSGATSAVQLFPIAP